MLARFGEARQPDAHVALAAEVSELDSLLQRRRDLEQMVQQEKSRFVMLLPPFLESTFTIGCVQF